MPKLYFRYGTMNSAKTANLLMMVHNYESKRSRVCVIKPSVDVRFGNEFVASRAGMQRKADILLEPDTCVEAAFRAFEQDGPVVHAVLVDECQFLTSQHVEALRLIALRINVFCFGLRTDYRSVLFEGSKRLLELADCIDEVKTTCAHCVHKAVITAKFQIDENQVVHFIVQGSDQPDLGAEDKYTSLCYACWHKRTTPLKQDQPVPVREFDSACLDALHN